MSDADPAELDRLAAALHAEGVARTEKARRTFRARFASDDEYRAYMIELGKKARDAKVAAARARRRARAAGAVKTTEPGATGGASGSASRAQERAA